MKLIKDLNIRKCTSKNGLTKSHRFSLFLCPVCGNEVERKKFDGLKQKKCCGGKSNISRKGSPLHNIFIGMTQRCRDKNSINYKNYGGRGIEVCKEWKNFDNFASWALNNGFKQGKTIDRIEVNGNYEPSNCKFSTMQEQGQNKRNKIHDMKDIENIKKDYVTTLMTIKDLSIKYKDSQGNIANIINGKTWKNVETEYDKYISTVSQVKQLIKGNILNFWKSHLME